MDKEIVSESRAFFHDEFRDQISELGYHLASGIGKEGIVVLVQYDRRLKKKDRKIIDDLLPTALVYRHDEWHYNIPDVAMNQDLLVHDYDEVEIPVKIRYQKTSVMESE